jgi:formylglycine-generating enzyme required for sulfatase activity
MKVAAPELMSIPAGPFLMGTDGGNENERPEREVQVEAYAIGVCPVTQAEYALFVEATGWRPPGVWELPAVVRPGGAERFRRVAAPYVWTLNRPPAGRESHPVVLVTFEDAREYCRWLSLETGEDYRLPTEAQWEKAARGGLERKRYPWGDNIDLSLANFTPDARQRGNQGTRPVKEHPANPFGVYGMAGNVWDWTSDWFRSSHDSAGSPENPAGPASGALRVVRGGAWVNDDVEYLRCSFRHPVPADTYSYSMGFRVVRPAKP